VRADPTTRDREVTFVHARIRYQEAEVQSKHPFSDGRYATIAPWLQQRSILIGPRGNTTLVNLRQTISRYVYRNTTQDPTLSTSAVEAKLCARASRL
jgi:hypothetical protein